MEHMDHMAVDPAPLELDLAPTPEEMAQYLADGNAAYIQAIADIIGFEPGNGLSIMQAVEQLRDSHESLLDALEAVTNDDDFVDVKEQARAIINPATPAPREKKGAK